MKSETIFAVLAIVLAGFAVAIGAISIGFTLGTQRQLDAFIAEYDERHGPPPSRPVIRPRRPGNTGATIGDLEPAE